MAKASVEGGMDVKKGVLAIYDSHREYAMHLMNYVNAKRNFPLEACVFTNEESLSTYMKNSVVDILLIGEECNMVDMCKSHVRHLVMLLEGKYVKEDGGIPVIYKFQSMERLLQKLLAILLEDGQELEGCGCSQEQAECIGFFSASGGSGKTSLALAVGRLLAKREETLYLSFELLPSLETTVAARESSGDYSPQGMSELLYYVKQKKENLALRVKSMTQVIQGLDCVYPVTHYGDLYDLEPREAEFLLQELKKSKLYRKILLDVGFLGDTAWTLLEGCRQIVVPQNLSSIADTKMKGLLQMLKAEGRENLCQRFVPVQVLQETGIGCPGVSSEKLPTGALMETAQDILCRLIPAV